MTGNDRVPREFRVRRRFFGVRRMFHLVVVFVFMGLAAGFEIFAQVNGAAHTPAPPGMSTTRPPGPPGMPTTSPPGVPGMPSTNAPLAPGPPGMPTTSPTNAPGTPTGP